MDQDCSLQVTPFQREQMVMLIEELALFKKYRTETLYSAVNIADRYLVKITVEG